MPLHVVATPIGNLADLSPRAREVLTQSAEVLCEDTRHTRRLYAALGLEAPRLRSCHAHNEAARVAAVLEQVANGADIALVSDAGTPGVSDPGGLVVAAVLAAGLPVRVVPGPSSVAGALSVSGFANTPHHFLGFPPRKRGELHSFLRRASRLEGPLVMLESGRRLGRLIEALQVVMSDREACICREPTSFMRRSCGPCRGPPDGGPTGRSGRGRRTRRGGRRRGDTPSGKGLLQPNPAPRWGCSKREAYQRLLALESPTTESAPRCGAQPPTGDVRRVEGGRRRLCRGGGGRIEHRIAEPEAQIRRHGPHQPGPVVTG